MLDCQLVEHPVVADLRTMYGHANASTKVLIERLSRAEAQLVKSKYEYFTSRSDLLKRARLESVRS
jgi:hypothetical protein